MEKWRFDDEICVACHFIIICLIMTCLILIYESSKNCTEETVVIMEYSYHGILYVKVYISFISTAIQIVCFCPKLGSLYLPFTPIRNDNKIDIKSIFHYHFWLSTNYLLTIKREKFLPIFIGILKLSHLDLSKLSL